MEYRHLQHLARAASALLNAPQVMVTGTAATIKALFAPSDRTKEMFAALTVVDVMIYDNDDTKGCVQILTQALGAESRFHRHFGYAINPQASWELSLPNGWGTRLVYLNTALRYGPQVFDILAPSLEDIVLNNMRNNLEPLLNMELLIRQKISISRLNEIFSGWNLDSESRWRVQEQISNLNSLVCAGLAGQFIDAHDGQDIMLPTNVVPIVGRFKKKVLA